MSANFKFHSDCPICGHELTSEDIDHQPKDNKVVSVLYCPKCNFKKKLDTICLDDLNDEEDDEDDGDDDDEGVNLFPDGRDYDAEDEDSF